MVFGVEVIRRCRSRISFNNVRPVCVCVCVRKQNSEIQLLASVIEQSKWFSILYLKQLKLNVISVIEYLNIPFILVLRIRLCPSTCDMCTISVRIRCFNWSPFEGAAQFLNDDSKPSIINAPINFDCDEAAFSEIGFKMVRVLRASGAEGGGGGQWVGGLSR